MSSLTPTSASITETWFSGKEASTPDTIDPFPFPGITSSLIKMTLTTHMETQNDDQSDEAVEYVPWFTFAMNEEQESTGCNALRTIRGFCHAIATVVPGKRRSEEDVSHSGRLSVKAVGLRFVCGVWPDHPMDFYVKVEDVTQSKSYIEHQLANLVGLLRRDLELADAATEADENRQHTPQRLTWYKTDCMKWEEDAPAKRLVRLRSRSELMEKMLFSLFERFRDRFQEQETPLSLRTLQDLTDTYKSQLEDDMSYLTAHIERQKEAHRAAVSRWNQNWKLD